MSHLPSGEVTFLFTDIAGSTRHWERNSPAMSAALARHDTLLRTLIEEGNGHVFKTVGDAFCATFAEPLDALRVAAAAQRALLTERFDQIGQLQVRMALHTGPAEVREADYFGPVVNRVARLLAIGHGGQVILSRATAEGLPDPLADGLTLLDLGGHRLKDLDRPEHVYQLAGPGLAEDFPPLTSLDARPNNLPTQPDALIGRETELESLSSLLTRDDVRIVTICGPGGIGKTRLALAVGADVSDTFPDGVWFVDLGPITDPAVVLPTIARVLGLPESPQHPIGEVLADALRNDTALLILDTMEHVITSASAVTALLAVCPGLKLLATSRVPLQVRGEHERRVQPLPLPQATTTDLETNPAVRLFVDRVRAIKPDFALDEATGPIVAAICIRLEGLPLALELAAARLRSMSPANLLTRLERRLPLLTEGARDAPGRQQTMNATIDWSYNLMSEAHQSLFRHLAVFAGGCTLTAVETIWPLPEPDDLAVLDGIDTLVSGSLLQPISPDADEPRFRMLDMIREYGLKQLEDHGEARLSRRHLAEWCFHLAEEAHTASFGPEQVAWLDRLESELNNIRSALTWLIDDGDIELALRLTDKLSWFWVRRGYLREGREWSERVLTARELASPEAQALGLNAAGILAYHQGDNLQALARYEESLAILRTLENTQALVATLNNLGLVRQAAGDYADASDLLQEAIGVLRATGDQPRLGTLLNNLGILEQNQGQFERARDAYEESLAIRRALGNHQGIRSCLGNLSTLASDLGQHERSIQYLNEAMVLVEALHDEVGRADVLSNLGAEEQRLGHFERARSLLLEALTIHREYQSNMGIAADLQNLGMLAHAMGNPDESVANIIEALEMWGQQGDFRGQIGSVLGLAEIAADRGDFPRVARLLGGITAMTDQRGLPHDLDYSDRGYDRVMTTVTAAFPGDEFERWFALGQGWTMEEIVAEALAVASDRE